MYAKERAGLDSRRRLGNYLDEKPRAWLTRDTLYDETPDPRGIATADETSSAAAAPLSARGSRFSAALASARERRAADAAAVGAQPSTSASSSRPGSAFAPASVASAAAEARAVSQRPVRIQQQALDDLRAKAAELRQSAGDAEEAIEEDRRAQEVAAGRRHAMRKAARARFPVEIEEAQRRVAVADAERAQTVAEQMAARHAADETCDELQRQVERVQKAVEEEREGLVLDVVIAMERSSRREASAVAVICRLESAANTLRGELAELQRRRAEAEAETRQLRQAVRWRDLVDRALEIAHWQAVKAAERYLAEGTDDLRERAEALRARAASDLEAAEAHRGTTEQLWCRADALEIEAQQARYQRMGQSSGHGAGTDDAAAGWGAFAALPVVVAPAVASRAA